MVERKPRPSLDNDELSPEAYLEARREITEGVDGGRMTREEAADALTRLNLANPAVVLAHETNIQQEL